MIKIIPRELIKHLEWTPGQAAHLVPPAPAAAVPVPQRGVFSLDDLINRGKPLYSDQQDGNGKLIGVAVSLQQTVEYAGAECLVASLPYLIAGKATADKNNYLWKNWFTALSEEDIGIDKKGAFVTKSSPVVITVHGGGILTPDRIMQAYREGLTPQNAAKFTNEEFDNLLRGVLPSGESIDLYTVDDVKRGIPDPFGRYAVALDFKNAKATTSGYHAKTDFLKNPLVLSRAGTPNHLEAYFDKAKSGGTVGNWHRLAEIEPNHPQGRLLFLGNDDGGLDGFYSLFNLGRFVGVVAPEAHRK
ncbi:hypothetical protein HYS49_02950 [Candidatus Woesearchaeota archaeon]|nr:hypothetical protein [Candidatus Woesearchaeota archaeon]